MSLGIEIATGPLLDDWRAIHNAIIPTDPLSADEVAERSTRNRLTLAYADDILVGNATVVLASNSDGLDFALARGFVEHDRYTLDGNTVPFVDLHLPEQEPGAV